MDELAQVTQRQKAMWGAGDYDPFAAMLRAVVGAGWSRRPAWVRATRSLDVACGTGNTCLAAVRTGARVTGVDITPRMLERARSRRRTREGVAITWVEGDAQALPFADASFDVALSTFGCMFAPDQERDRLGARPASCGRAAGSASPAGPRGRSGRGSSRVVGAFLPPPPAGAGDPLAWGDDGHVARAVRRRRAGRRGEHEPPRVDDHFDSLDDAVTTYITRFGPLVVGRPGFEEAGVPGSPGGGARGVLQRARRGRPRAGS